MEEKFSTRCRLLAVFSPVIAALLLVRAAWVWGNFEQQLLPYYQGQGVRVTMAAMAPWQQLSAGIVATIPLALVCLALLRAGRVFRLVARGERIADGVIRNLTGISSLIFYAALIKIPLDAATSLLLTINNQAGDRSIRLGFSSAELVGLIAAGLFWALAWTLREALAIRQENEAFI